MTRQEQSLSITETRDVVGYYKSLNLKDADAIYVERKMLLNSLDVLTVISLLFLMFGVLFTLVGLGVYVALIIGIPCLVISAFTFTIKKRKKGIIMAGTEQYCSQIGVTL